MTSNIQENQTDIVDTTQNQFISSEFNIQQKMQDLKRIHFLQQLQKLQQLQQIKQNQQELEKNSFEQQVNPILTKIKLINSDSIDEIRVLIKDLNQKIDLSLDQIDKININEFKNRFNIVFEKLLKYNDSIDTWHDNKYISDKEKFYASIEEEQKLFSFEKLDFISIGCSE